MICIMTEQIHDFILYRYETVFCHEGCKILSRRGAYFFTGDTKFCLVARLIFVTRDTKFCIRRILHFVSM